MIAGRCQLEKGMLFQLEISMMVTSKVVALLGQISLWVSPILRNNATSDEPFPKEVSRFNAQLGFL